MDPITLRPAVAEHAEEMERQLRTHDAQKGERGWWDLSAEYLDSLFIDQGTELRDALLLGKPKDIVHKAADVANIAMMIADNARRRGGN